MNPNKRYPSTLLTIFAIFVFHALSQQSPSRVQSNEPYYYKVGDRIQGKNTAADNGRGFHPLQLESLQMKYLFAEVAPSPSSQFTNMSVYMFRGTEQSPFKTCKNIQSDSCYIGRESLSPNQKLLAIVDCGSACEYTLKFYWSDLEHIRPGDITKFLFGEKQTQIYHLELGTRDYAELRLIIRPETKREMFDSVAIFGKFGKDSSPTAEDYDFKSMHLWGDAEGIYLYKQEVLDSDIQILVVGHTETIYLLSCEVVNETVHEMYPGESLQEYLEPQEEAKYHLSFTNEQGVAEYEEYVVKFAGFSGNLSVAFYTDEALSQVYSYQPYEYMLDAQFLLPKPTVEQDLPDGLFLKVNSQDRISTFGLELNGRMQESSIQLNEHIFEFLEVKYQEEKFLYFEAFMWQMEETYGQNYIFTVNLLNVRGTHGIRFRICEKEFDKCLEHSSYSGFSQELNSSTYDEIGAKKSFRVEVPKEKLISINSVESKMVVLMIVSSMEQSSTMCAVEYYEDNKFQVLRESRPVEARLSLYESKMYKFTNVDHNIKEIRIHVNRISGKVDVISLRNDPNVENNGALETSNVVSVTTELLEKPVFLIVSAKSEAIVSLDVQLIHKNEDFESSITLQEEVEFSINIQPQGYEFLEVHPMFDAIYFEYQSSGRAIVCEYLAEENKCKRDLPEMGTRGTLQVQKFLQRSELFMIRNPSEDKLIKFTAKYHSGNYSHCQQRHTGKVYEEIVKDTECFAFSLERVEEFEISVSRVDLGLTHMAFMLCNNLLKLQHEHGKERYKVSNQTVQENCEGQQSKALVIMISGAPPAEEGETKKIKMPFDSNVAIQDEVEPKDPSVAKVKISVQYPTGDGIEVADGMAYEMTRVSSEEALAVFYYEILNPVKTTILLANRVGGAYFTAKVVKTVERHKFGEDGEFDYSSNSSDYFMNPVVTIEPQDFQNHSCQKDCSLVIRVFSRENLGSTNTFSLQVTQNYFKLQEHSPKSQFLSKGAFSYYSFNNKEEGNSLLVETSDNNLQCTRIYFSNREYPSMSNNDIVETGNQLIFQEAQNQTYFIAVEALEDCPFSISISTTHTHITRLERNHLGYLKLEQGEVKYFMLHRLSANPFKILSVHVYGDVKFYLNRSDSEEIASLVNKRDEEIDYESFRFESEFKNRLLMDDEESLCSNCYYILACYANKNSDTSIFLGDKDSFLPISLKKSVNDFLKNEGDSLKGYLYDVEPLNIKVKVHSGELGVSIKYRSQEFSQSFPRLDDLYQEEFALQRTGDDWSPANVEFKALEPNTIYSIRFASKQSSEDRDIIDEAEIEPGFPNFVYIEEDRVLCLKGFLRQRNEMVMLTTDDYNREALNGVKVQTVVDGQEFLNNQKEIVRNILTVKFDLGDVYVSEGKPYSVCLNSEYHSFSATAFQTEELNVLPQDVESIVVGEQEFVIRPEGSFLIDVFECEGKANITYAESMQELPTATTNGLGILGISSQPHAFRIEEYMTTFLKVESTLSTVRWIPIDEGAQSGLGYAQYQSGYLKYSASEDTIDLEWEGVARSKQGEEVATELVSVNYTIYVSNTLESLQSAQNCDIFQHEGVLVIRPSNEGTSQSVIQKYQLPKSELTAKYAREDESGKTGDIYISVSADVDIRSKVSDDPQMLERYKFFYGKQQIAKQVFLTNDEYLNTAFDIAWIVAAVIAFLIFTWACTTKIIPMLARLKNRWLVEEDDKKDEELGDVPPPSSERKTIQEEHPGTQDKMSDAVQSRN